MGRRLNDISDADAAATLARLEDEIESWERLGPSSDERRSPAEAPRYYEVASDLYFRAMALAHQQQRPTDHVFHYLHWTGVRSLELLEHRDHPIAATHRDFYKMVDRYLGALAWCTQPDVRTRLGAIHESRYHWPHDPKWTFTPGSRELPRQLHSHYRVTYMRLAIDAFTTGHIDVPRVQDAVRELDADTRHVAERGEAGHCYWALLGIADRNSGFLGQTLAQLLELHRAEAVGGHYRNKAEGLVAMNVVFLLGLARDHGVSVPLRSDYLPAAVLAF